MEPVGTLKKEKIAVMSAAERQGINNGQQLDVLLWVVSTNARKKNTIFGSVAR